MAANPLTVAETARRLAIAHFTDVLNARRLDRLDDLFAPNVVYHSAGSPDMVGLPAVKTWIVDYLKAVPDYQAEILDTVAEVGKAVLRWSCTGTHQGTLMGIPATGKRFTLSGITVFHVQGGRIVEGWVERDSLGLAKRLQG